MKMYKFNILRKFLKAGLWIAIFGGSHFACQVSAEEISNTAPQRFGNWDRASDSELDQLRGGFVLANGVNVDFSLDRITSLNGAVVSSSFFQSSANMSLFQNGALNQAPDLAGAAGLGSIIQNNMDNQVIRNATDINITVSNLKNLDLNNNGMIFNSLILPNVH
ncbi:hypothetical protein [Methylobacter sp.]|uniref:hypothetical protein n=1 Tax=Methylobacter sp. TaxID=2051955 RepID=UPI002FDE6C28